MSFIHLLNSMEVAAASDKPADLNYKGRRELVLHHVKALEDEIAELRAMVTAKNKSLNEILTEACIGLNAGKKP